MDENTAYYYKSARNYFLPVKAIDEINGFILRLGKKNYFFRGRETPFNNLSSAKVALNKYCTNKLLQMAGIPVPMATALHRSEYENGLLDVVMADLKFPVVVKPTLGGLGKDVLCNVQALEQLRTFLDAMFPVYEYLSIEEFHGGLKSYRVLVFNKRIIGVIYREPAYVLGNGQHSIRELIDLTNADRAKLNDILAPIVIDEECHFRLAEHGITLDYIPREREKIRLGYTSNASRGGSFTALKNNRICKENRKLMVRIAELLNLDLAGIDVECEDISVPLELSSGVILEVNHCPSIRIHENPPIGEPNPVSKKIIRKLIFRHPFSYLAVLYRHERTYVYVRSFILLSFLAILYKIISKLT